MKISTQKAIGWVLLCMGLGGVVLFLWIIGRISVEDSRVPGEVVEWAVVSGVMATGALIMLIRCYRRESLGGRKILHLSLADLIVSSVFAAFLMGIGHVYLSEMEFLLLVVPAVLLAMAVLLAGLMLAGREGLIRVKGVVPPMGGWGSERLEYGSQRCSGRIAKADRRTEPLERIARNIWKAATFDDVPEDAPRVC